MTAPLGLLGFAILVWTVACPWLGRATWPSRSPALGIIAWQAATGSIVLSATLAGLSLAAPEIPAAEGLADFLHACSRALQEHYATPAGAGLSIVGGAFAALLTGRLAYFWIIGAAKTHRDGSRQRDMLALVGSSHPAHDVVVLEHHVPTAYCLPGRNEKVVVTTAALEALTDNQLSQVLAHERAHLQARHHWVLLTAEALASTFAHRGPFARAHREIAELAEMHADDAADHAARRDLAAAVVILAGGARPAGAMGAAGGSALARVRRLTGPSDPLGSSERVALSIFGALLVLTPLAIASAPGIAGALADYCPIVFGG